MNRYPNPALRVVRAVGLVALAMLLMGPVITRLVVVPPARAAESGRPARADGVMAIADPSGATVSPPLPAVMTPRSLAASVLRHRAPSALFLSLLLVTVIGSGVAPVSWMRRHRRESGAAPRPAATRGLCRRGPPRLTAV
jgi:hypothetical protein